MRDTADRKALRLKEITKLIYAQLNFGLKVERESLLDRIEYDYGLRRKKAREYLALILKVNAHLIEENGEIKLLEGEEKQC